MAGIVHMLEIKHIFKSSAELELTEFGTSSCGAVYMKLLRVFAHL